MQYENVNKYDVKKWKLQRGSYALGEGPSGYVSGIECMANICVDFHHPAMLYLVHTHTQTHHAYAHPGQNTLVKTCCNQSSAQMRFLKKQAV